MNPIATRKWVERQLEAMRIQTRDKIAEARQVAFNCDNILDEAIRKIENRLDAIETKQEEILRDIKDLTLLMGLPPLPTPPEPPPSQPTITHEGFVQQGGSATLPPGTTIQAETNGIFFVGDDLDMGNADVSLALSPATKNRYGARISCRKLRGDAGRICNGNLYVGQREQLFRLVRCEDGLVTRWMFVGDLMTFGCGATQDSDPHDPCIITFDNCYFNLDWTGPVVMSFGSKSEVTFNGGYIILPRAKKLASFWPGANVRFIGVEYRYFGEPNDTFGPVTMDLFDLTNHPELEVVA
jgi:hypothetical protein